MSGSEYIGRELGNIASTLHEMLRSRNDIEGTLGNVADEVGGAASYLQSIDENLNRIADVLEYFERLVKGVQGGDQDIFGAGGSAPGDLHGNTGPGEHGDPGGGPPHG